MSVLWQRTSRLALAVALVLLAVAGAVDRWYATRIHQHARDHVRERMLPYAEAVDRAIDRRMGVLTGLSAFVSSRRTRTELERDFAVFARGARSVPGVRSLQYFDGGRITRIEPLAGNEGALGLDVARDPRPEVRADHAQVMASRGPQVFGPVPLREGGNGILLRERLPDRPGFPQIVAVVIDAASITSVAGIPDTLSGLTLELLRDRERWSEGDVLDATAEPVLIRLDVPGEHWSLRGAPRQGWRAAERDWRLSVRLTLLAVVLLVTLLVVVIAGREARLTREAAASGSALGVAMRAGGTGVWSIDLTTRQVEASGIAAEVLGEARGHAVAPLERLPQGIAPSHRATLTRHLDELARGERTHGSLELAVPAGDGGTRWLMATCQRVPGEDGRSVVVLGALADVTVQRRLDERLRQAQQLEALGQLAGSVAHDFNNLLVAVGGFAEFALSHLEQAKGATAAAVAADVRAALAGARDGARLTRQLLAFSRRGAVAPARVEVSGVVTELQPLLDRLFAGRLAIAVDLAPGLPAVRGDAGWMTRMILGLLLQLREQAPARGWARIRTYAVAPTGERPNDAPPGDWVTLEVAAAGVLAPVGAGTPPGGAPPIGADAPEAEGLDVGALPAGELGLAVLASGVEATGGHLVVAASEGEYVVRAYLPRWIGS